MKYRKHFYLKDIKVAGVVLILIGSTQIMRPSAGFYILIISILTYILSSFFILKTKIMCNSCGKSLWTIKKISDCYKCEKNRLVKTLFKIH